MSTVQIIGGDSLDLRDMLPHGSVDLVVTSPPYNLGKDYHSARDNFDYGEYIRWTREWGTSLKFVLREGARVCLNLPIDINTSFKDGKKKRSAKLPILADMTGIFVEELGFIYNTTILWLERNVSKRTAWGSWLSASDPWVNTAAEAILVLSHKTRKREGKHSDLERDEFMDWTLGIWDFPGENRTKKHPAPFPEELPRRLIKLYSFPTDTVLDPFVGSGTTAVVAKRLKRNVIGVDINSEYCKMARQRCAQMDMYLDG